MSAPHESRPEIDTSKPQHWAVEVRVDGVTILTIETSWLSGVPEPELDRHADTIRGCAEHLLAFIGPRQEGLS